MEDIVERFERQASAAQSAVHQLSDWGEVGDLALQLAGDGHVAVAPSLAAQHPALCAQLGSRLLTPDSDQPFSSIADVSVGIVRAIGAVAETGSVLLSQHAEGDRAVSMLADTAIQVVERSEIRRSFEEFASLIRSQVLIASLVTMVTGPSRTADIERSLTIGVQGPSAVHVVVLR